MGMTIAEKIIALAAGVPEVKAGDIHTVTLDRMMSNDGTTHLTVDMYNNKLKHPHIADAKKMVFIVDHNVPADSPKTAASQKKMRDFARENNIDFWEGKGVCHQIMMEHYVCPGELSRSRHPHLHLWVRWGAFGTGVGCTDLLYGHGNRNLLGVSSGDRKIQPDRQAAGGCISERFNAHHHRSDRCQRRELPGDGVHRRRRKDLKCQ